MQIHEMNHVCCVPENGHSNFNISKLDATQEAPAIEEPRKIKECQTERELLGRVNFNEYQHKSKVVLAADGFM